MYRTRVGVIIEWVYSLTICLALFFHVFNEISITESIKLFHIPTVIASITAIFIANKNNKIFLNVCLIVVLSLCGSAVSVQNDSMFNCLKFILVILGCSGLIFVDRSKVIRVMNIMTPILLFFLLIHYYKGNYYRYSVWYNDPNYFCTTLLLLLYSIISLFESKKMFVKIFAIIEIGIIVMLISFSISRTGLLCLLLILLIVFWKFLKKQFFLTIAVCLSLLIFGFQSGFFQEMYDSYNTRMFENTDNLEHAADYRFMTSMEGVNYVVTNPINLVLGVGFGGTFGNKAIPTKKHWHADHNTYTSFFSEQGLFVFASYIIILVFMFKRLFKYKNWKDLSFLFSMSIFAISISMKPFLPYWFFVFLLCSNYIYKAK